LALPTSGTGWDNVTTWANKTASSPDLSDQDDPDNITVFAKALVYARTGDTSKRNEVITALQQIRGTESGARALAIGRELGAYILAADLIGYREPSFVSWVSAIRTHPTTSGPSNIIDCHDKRPNNWGTHCGASRIIADIYLGDTVDLNKAVNTWKGWMGDRAAYSGFSYGSLSWQSNPSQPVGINPKGATISGHSVDGVLPDDQRRGGNFTWPPPCENYVHEALQGANLALAVLSTYGLPMGTWEDQAIVRAYSWLYNEANCPATGDDTFSPYIVNHFIGTNIPETSSRPGKGFGFSEWLYN
jgi:hypothetical protein